MSAVFQQHYFNCYLVIVDWFDFYTCFFLGQSLKSIRKKCLLELQFLRDAVLFMHFLENDDTTLRYKYLLCV